MFSQSVTSPNIALIKYWGKYDDDLILPINDSISFTLNPQDLATTTTISFSKFNEVDTLTLNGVSQPISKRLVRILEQAKSLGAKSHSNILEEYEQCHFKIESNNSFPTASGLASSASGLASIAICLNQLFGGCFDSQKISELARLGSGSASRSIYGGLVKWRGVPQYPLTQTLNQQQLQQLSHECISQQVLPSQKLKEWRVIILLAHQKKKQTSSTQGMKRSTLTSQFIKMRNNIAKERIQTLIESLRTEDISTFSETIIRDSNSFHAVCLDTYPPIHYLNDFSKQVMFLVDHVLNSQIKSKVAYTFDAGPHAFVIVHQSEFPEVFNGLLHFYSIGDNQLNEKGVKCKKLFEGHNVTVKYPNIQPIPPVKMVVTDIGRGPMDLTQTP